MDYIISDKAYKVIKWAVLIVLPALATFLSVVLPAVGVDAGVSQTVTTVVTALATFGGGVLGVSAATAKPSASTDEKGA